MDKSESDPHTLLSTVQKGNQKELDNLLNLESLDDTRNNCLALNHAIKTNDIESVKLLLGNGCNVNGLGADVLHAPIHCAIETGNLEIIELLLDAGASLITNFGAKTPVYKAMKKQQFDVVDLMLSKYKIENINPNNKQEFVHFVIACVRNNEQLVEHFINKNINVNGVLDDYAEEWSGYTPLYLSVKYLSAKVVEILLNHQADFSFQDKNKNSPLHLAYYAWISNISYFHKRVLASDIMDFILMAHTRNLNNLVNKKGLSHFHIACMGRNATLVQCFLQSGRVDVNSRISMYPKALAATVPLHLAVKHCSIGIAKILLEHKADVDVKDEIGKTPLQIALYKKLYDLAELLLEFKAVISTDCKKCYNTIFQVFHDYPRTGKIIDSMFLACKENIVNLVNEDGLSLLHVACTRNNIDVIKKLLLTTPDVNAQVHKKSIWDGYTALHFAASAQNLDAIRELLKHKADVKIVEAQGLTPLWLSLEAQPKYSEIKNIINEKLENADENFDEDQIIDLVTRELKNIEVLELLCRHKSNLNHKSYTGDPLLVAAYQALVTSFENRRRNPEEIVSKLCNKYFQMTATKIMSFFIEHGMNLNHRDKHGSHILHNMVHSMKNSPCFIDIAVEMAELVLKNGVDVNVSNRDGNTPLHLATKYRSLQFVELFLKYDADIEAVNQRLSTPLHTACSINRYILRTRLSNLAENFARINDAINHILPSLAKRFSVLECLLRLPCNVNAGDGSGQTPLFLAAMNSYPDCVKLLLNHGADMNVKDRNNKSLLENVFSAYELRNHRDRSRFAVIEALVWHALKLMLIGQPVDPSNLLRCQQIGDRRFEFYYSKTLICVEEDYDSIIPCKYTASLREEVEKLKETKIDCYYSLYEMLGKNVQQMTRHVRKKALEDQVGSEDLSTRFPNYGYLLKLKFADGLARDEILEKALESFQYFARTELPHICVDNIFSYITNKDMKNLLLAAR